MAGWVLMAASVIAWLPVLAGGHCEGTTLVDTYGYTLLEESRDVPDVTLRAVAIRFCVLKGLEVQIWKKAERNLYTLIWARVIFPDSLDSDLVHDIPPSDTIRLNPEEDKLGLYVLDRSDLPVFARWGDPAPDRFRTFYSERDGPFSINQTYGFMTDLINPIAFNITLCGNPGCTRDVISTSSLPPETPPTTATTTTTTTATTTTAAPTTTLKTPAPPTPGLACVPAGRRSTGRALVESSRRLPGGVLLGVRVMTCLLQPYLLQVWDSAPGGEFTLVWQRWIIPRADDGTVQVVLFRVEEYLVSSATFRAGIQLDPYLSLSVPNTGRAPDPLLVQSREIRDFNPCQSVTFDPTEFTWDLALDFCTTLDCTPSNAIQDYLPYSPPCPRTTSSSPTPTTRTTSSTTTQIPTTSTDPTTSRRPTVSTRSTTRASTLSSQPSTAITQSLIFTQPSTTTTQDATVTQQSTITQTTIATQPSTTTTQTTISTQPPATTTDTTTFTQPPATTTETTTFTHQSTTTTEPRITSTQPSITSTLQSTTVSVPSSITTAESKTNTLQTSTVTNTKPQTVTQQPVKSSTSTQSTRVSTPKTTTQLVSILTDMTETVTSTTRKSGMTSTRRSTSLMTTREMPGTTTSPTPSIIPTTTMVTPPRTKKPRPTPMKATTTKKSVKPTQSQNNVLKVPTSRSAAASGKNSGSGVHSHLKSNKIFLMGLITFLLHIYLSL